MNLVQSDLGHQESVRSQLIIIIDEERSVNLINS